MFLIIDKKKILILSAFLAFTFALAAAGSFFFHAQSVPAASNTKEHGKFLILVYVEENKLYLFEDDKLVKQYTTATGKPGWPSPIGEWKIIQKGSWGEGFGGYWLGLNVPWGKYGIHGTTNEASIGRYASHGCIRLGKNSIKELYQTVPIGTSVVIKNGSYGSFGTGFRNLIPGDRGADVLAVQRRLKQLGYYKSTEDGVYGEEMKQALYRFQKEKNLRIKFTITKADYESMGLYEFE